MLKFIPDRLKTKKNVPDRYKTEQVYNKTISENGETLKCVPDCYKNPHDNYPHALEFKPEYYMTQNTF